MKTNPEFKRNIWLELTIPRIIGMPLVLFTAFFFIKISSKSGLESSAISSMIVFGMIVFLWGTRAAAESIITEIRDRTWDCQRMSAIGPWDMTLGKLFGSTIYQWYGGFICLLIYITSSKPAENVLKNVILLTLCGIFSHGLGLLAGLLSIRKERRYNRGKGSALAVFAVLPVFPVLLKAYGDNISWYGHTYNNIDFIIGSLFFFTVWTIFGIYRLMRSELQMRSTSLAWLLFVVFLIFYSAGFVNNADGSYTLTGRLTVSFLITVFSTYLMIFTERKYTVDYLRLIKSFKTGGWKNEMPCWMATLSVAFVAGCALLFADSSVMENVYKIKDFRALTVSFFFFLLRDIGIILYFNLSGNLKRADMAAMFSFIMLYIFIPGILLLSHYNFITIFFCPRYEYPFFGLVTVLIEVIVVYWILYRRWNATYGMNDNYNNV